MTERWDWELQDSDVTMWIKLLNCPDGIDRQYLEPQMTAIPGGIMIEWKHRHLELTLEQQKQLKYESVVKYITNFLPVDREVDYDD